MRSRTAAALVAVATILSARPMHAAPLDHALGMLSDNAAYFQTMARAIDGHRPGRDSSGAALVPGGSDNRLYAAGGAVLLGVVAAFLLDGHGSDDDGLIDDPTIPGQDGPGGDNGGVHDDGGVHDIVNPNQPNVVIPDATTVTPEPASLLLVGTGLSSLGAMSFRRRRSR